MKYIIVTGDSGDLGREIVKKILIETDFGVIGLSRNMDLNSDLLRINKNRYINIKFDLSNPEKIKNLFINKIREIGEIVGLVNNSAMAYDDIITNVKLNQLEKMFKVNVISPIILIKYTIREMLLRNVSGSIVNISSVSASTGYKGLAMYGSSKGGLEVLTKGIAREWGCKGIRCNAVAPGFMETNMSADISIDIKNKIFMRTCLKKPVEIESVVDTILFLLSEKSKSITGTVIHVDNGSI